MTLLLALLIAAPITGWFSVGLDPVTRITLDCSISAMELVMAPEPKDAASPATVELCQRRAQ